MARTATVREESMIGGEQVLREDLALEGSEPVLCRVIYLGGNPNKTERIHGTVVTHKTKDDEGKPVVVGKTFSPEGYTSYDFTSRDTLGRRLPEEQFIEGKRFNMVEHPGHLVYFFRLRDAEKQPVYEVRGEPIMLQRLQKYVNASRRRVVVEIEGVTEGTEVLRQMGLA